MAPTTCSAPAPAAAAATANKPFPSAFTSAAQLCHQNLSFSAEPVEVDVLLALSKPGDDGGDADAHGFGAEEDLEDLHPANMRRVSRATNAGLAYARTLSCALETAASTQLTSGAAGVSGPQGKVLPFTVIDDPAAWTAKDWAGGISQIVHELSPSDQEAIKSATAAFISTGAPLHTISKPHDFPLPKEVEDQLAVIKRELLRGRGVAVLRGMPLDDFETEKECVAAYLGVCCHIGQCGPQWKCGRLVTHVTSRGATVTQNLEASKHGPEAFNRSDAFEMHNDSCADVLGLMCFRQAKEGGSSAFCSALAVYNEMMRRGRLDLVAVLSGAGFYRDKSRFHPEIMPGASPLWEMPVFSWHDGYMTTSYNANLNKQCEERYPELAGKLSPLQREAMEVFNEIANSDAMKLEVRLTRGDIAWINNINTMHSRSTFVDGEVPRHLARVWLLCKDSPHTLPKHLDYPRSYSFTSQALHMARRADGLMHGLKPASMYVPLSTGERA